MQILDVSKDPYGRRFYAKKNRKAFEALKRTAVFKEWKDKQFKTQGGRCAYCKIPLRHKDIVTHIDHVQPLIFEGSNKFDNLVLSCRRCNLRKWIATNRVVPEWVRERAEAEKRYGGLKEIRKQQAKLMQELVQQQYEEQVAYELRQMFKG